MQLGSYIRVIFWHTWYARLVDRAVTGFGASRADNRSAFKQWNFGRQMASVKFTTVDCTAILGHLCGGGEQPTNRSRIEREV